MHNPCPHCGQHNYKSVDFCLSCDRPTKEVRSINGVDYLIDAVITVEQRERMNPEAGRYWRKTGVTSEFACWALDDRKRMRWGRTYADGSTRVVPHARMFRDVGLGTSLRRLARAIFGG